MRILITGISGFLGWNLARRLSRENDIEILGTYWRHPPATPPNASFRVDLEREEALDRVVRETRPDAVIHMAAIASTAVCETDPERGRRLNSLVAGTLARALERQGAHARLIYCSSDLVFDGLEPPYAESAAPTPRHVYAETKLEGERLTLDYAGSSVVARLALMFGDGPTASRSFLGWLDPGLRSPEGVGMFRDEIRTALYAPDAAEALLTLARGKGADGLYHLGGPERLSRADFARVYAEVFELDPRRVRDTRLSDAGGSLYRSPDVSLDIGRARREIGFAPRAAREALEDLARQRAY